MMSLGSSEPDHTEFVEVDPSGRYGRYDEILGKGASKTVYRAFDEYEGIEVAWNQVKLYDFLQRPEDLERLYCEIHLLQTLKHKNIMKFYTSWVDVANRRINFVTELFTSGTLRQYRQKHRRVNLRAIKHWCRQILRGLLYLHSHDPPVIHRDLKCDNIFVNGNQGEVKIGDLGLAAILRNSHAAHCVGTPEFMAPEVYEEEYNELVDIYSFGMCLLEMVTFEYPYSECNHTAQIYKKVTSGIKPESLYKVKDPQLRAFVEKCLVTASRRLSAGELLKDPFLQIEDYEFVNKMLEDEHEVNDINPRLKHPKSGPNHGNVSITNGYSIHEIKMLEYEHEVHDINPRLMQPKFDPYHGNGSTANGYSIHEMENTWRYDMIELEPHGIGIFTQEDDHRSVNVDISIKGKQRDDGGISLRLRITDKEGRVRNIYFPFDTDTDTALSVATEMVAELDMNDQDATRIADIIDAEICSLVPEWMPGPGIDDASPGYCHHCQSQRSSTGSFFDYHSSNPNSRHFLQCPRRECGAMHGRFEEITYQVKGSDDHVTVTKALSPVSIKPDILHNNEFWTPNESPDTLSEGSERGPSDEESRNLDQSIPLEDETIIHMDKHIAPTARKSQHHRHSGSIDAHDTNCVARDALSDDYDYEIRQELRWLKAKYQIEMRELRAKQVEGTRKALPTPKDLDNADDGGKDGATCISSVHSPSYVESNKSSDGKHSGTCSSSLLESGCPILETLLAPHCERTQSHESSPELFTAKSFYSGAGHHYTLHKTQSLPLDIGDVSCSNLFQYHPHSSVP